MNMNIHRHFTSRAGQHLGQNPVLQAPPPEIHPSEATLDRTDRVHLARLRAGHHPALLTYRKRFELDDTTDDTCPNCRLGIHNITHIMEHCTVHATLMAVCLNKMCGKTHCVTTNFNHISKDISLQ